MKNMWQLEEDSLRLKKLIVDLILNKVILRSVMVKKC